MFSATADTNIWVSAFNYRGNPRRLIDMAEQDKIELAVSEDIVEETRRILRQRFGWASFKIDLAEAEMRAVSKYVEPRLKLDIVKEDSSDNRIVECAVEAGSDYLITGDKHLLRIGRYGRLQIVKVAAFLEIALLR